MDWCIFPPFRAITGNSSTAAWAWSGSAPAGAGSWATRCACAASISRSAKSTSTCWMRMRPRVMVRCARPGAAAMTVHAVPGAVAGTAAAGVRSAGAAGVADSRRNFVYGLHAINAVLERSPQRVLELWVAQKRDDVRTRELRERALGAGVRVQAVNGEALVKLVGDVGYQGAVAAVRPLPGWDEHDLIDSLSRTAGDALLLILDGVTDPHNLGACLRTADAAGAHAVLIPKDRAAAVDGV